MEEARSLLSSGDPLLENEAALVLSGWRVRYGHGVPDDPGRLSELLRRSASRTAAAVRLGLLTADAGEVPPDAVGHPDPETAFTAALARGDVDRLVTALTGETLERIAAGSRLVDLEAYAPLDRPLRDGPLEVQRRLVEALAARRRPAPPLAEALVEIVEKSSDAVVREGASRVLCRQLRPDLALRIARAAEGSRSIFQLLLLPAAGLPDETVAELLSWMVESGTFRSSQFGLEGVAERGAVPDDLVPRLFARAGDEMRRELLGLAEVQLRSRGDEVLHRFVMNVVFGPYPVTTRSAAWWVLRRWYLRTDPRGEGPFRLTPESIVRFFGTVDLFVPLLAGLLADPEALADPTLRDLLGSLFRAVEKEGAAALAAAKGPERLVRALLGALRADAWPSPGEGTVRLLGLIGNDSRWKADVISGLLALGRAGNHHWETALRSLQPAER